MKYENTLTGVFIERPNRFVAYVEINGQTHICHVKNTGRCKELLIPGTKVVLQKAANSARKTAYDLIAVYKNGRLINMDSNAANTVFGEFLRSGGLGYIPEYIKAEQTHGDSRFDFYFEHDGQKCYAEVKGVTLEDDNVVRFPDAPTQRGIKHLRALMNCVAEGYQCYAVFIIQMKGVRFFEANRDTHPEFADVLKNAREAGVTILAYDCAVKENELTVSDSVEINV